MNDEKYCQSCGMPMRTTQEFGGGNPENLYCTYCTDDSGNLKSYEEVFGGMVAFTMQNGGVTQSEAEKMAKEGMAKQPAWRDR
jgi:hypothetical protein